MQIGREQQCELQPAEATVQHLQRTSGGSTTEVCYSKWRMESSISSSRLTEQVQQVNWIIWVPVQSRKQQTKWIQHIFWKGSLEEPLKPGERNERQKWLPVPSEKKSDAAGSSTPTVKHHQSGFMVTDTESRHMSSPQQGHSQFNVVVHWIHKNKISVCIYLLVINVIIVCSQKILPAL